MFIAVQQNRIYRSFDGAIWEELNYYYAFSNHNNLFLGYEDGYFYIGKDGW